MSDGHTWANEMQDAAREEEMREYEKRRSELSVKTGSAAETRILVVTYRFEIPTTLDAGECPSGFFQLLHKNPTWPMDYLKQIEAEVIQSNTPVRQPDQKL